MPHPDLSFLTGAFSYTGSYVTRCILDEGVLVRTRTRSGTFETLSRWRATRPS